MSSSSPSTEEEPDQKRRKTSKHVPTSFVTWNCNGFASRAKWDGDQLGKLLKETNFPDMICMQEARLKAYDATQRHRPLPSEYSQVKDAVETIFQDYQPVWSLADTRYAGTLTMVHKRLLVDKQHFDLNDKFMAFSLDSAIDLLLSRYNLTRKVVGLKEKEGDPTEKKLVVDKKQMTMTSFFTKKPAGSTAKPSTGSNGSSSSKKHHPEGRIQFFSFEDFDVLQTYVPNNGTKDESFQKRQNWDEQMLQFIKDRKKLLKAAGLQNRGMLWCGDLNVAKEYLDGSHWVTKKIDSDQKEDNSSESIYEWWTDEDKCFVGGKKENQPKHPDNVGIPSFTPAERRRFREILQEGGFVDVWRERYPNGVTESKLAQWDRPNYTWRGHLSKPGAGYAAKYQGKGQRLDYFLLSPSEQLLPSVEYCEILGYGERREGLFCGSDHCASLMRLKDSVDPSPAK